MSLVPMKLWVSVFLLGIPSGAAVIHSLKFFETTSTQVPNFPEYVVVGYVDDVQVVYYDSNTRTFKPKQDWVKGVVDEKDWEREAEIASVNQQRAKAYMETVKQRFNQTGGLHIFQQMYGCEWDEETNDINGYRQDGFDGEDFIVLDLKTETWVAPRPQAVLTKHKLERVGEAQYWKNYIHNRCIEWLKRYIDRGKKYLLRKELPSVSLLQRTPSSPLRCHATGFYPDRADLFWTRDGEELHEEVVKGEILPNHDGTFQMSVDLDLSSVQTEDWARYNCVFQLSGVKEDHITKLEAAAIRTNSGFPAAAAVVGGVVALIILAGCCIIGFLIWKQKPVCLSGFQPANTSDSSSSSTEGPDHKSNQ